MLGETLTLLAPEIRSRGAEVEVGDLPWVEADATLIAAVFTNLLTNALKFGPREGARIRVGRARDGAGWRFLVKSQGRAIAPEDRERIFEPYRRGRDERRERGTGLGLAICREIVTWHGGRIGIRSADGRYNAFWFTLPAQLRPARNPRVQRRAATEGHDRADGRGGGGDEERDPPARGSTIPPAIAEPIAMPPTNAVTGQV